MKFLYKNTKTGFLCFSLLIMVSCNIQDSANEQEKQNTKAVTAVKMEAEKLTHSSSAVEIFNSGPDERIVRIDSGGWIALDVEIPVAGRYRSQIRLKTNAQNGVTCWIEDYYDNEYDRTFNITGNISVAKPTPEFTTPGKDGSPLNAGLHKMKVHFDHPIQIDWIKFTLMRPHETTPKALTQAMDGDEWKVVWSDEFDGENVDTTKWTYDIGNWGWGNGEEQYYTENRTENARTENGNLVIEARRNDMGHEWTSARLTTRGKVSFLYGKIEFRAKVPQYRGNWAAGWTLGDEYVDEISWPFCGEIDILESVGYEMNDSTGNGIAHASAHSGAYYFKLGNQPTATIAVENMNNKFHTYAVEWTPEEIRAYVDDILYFTYDDNSSELSWPFYKPQNIILNLTMGGGWGGYFGIDENVGSQKMIIDYVRVYELR
jgi:beta-glucanase (GH16 family)